jgi:hypothetical protein
MIIYLIPFFIFPIYVHSQPTYVIPKPMYMPQPQVQNGPPNVDGIIPTRKKDYDKYI